MLVKKVLIKTKETTVTAKTAEKKTVKKNVTEKKSTNEKVTEEWAAENETTEEIIYNETAETLIVLTSVSSF